MFNRMAGFLRSWSVATPVHPAREQIIFSPDGNDKGWGLRTITHPR